MIITICSSSSFFCRLHEIEQPLKERGYDILIPDPELGDKLNDESYGRIKEELIRKHFDNIERSHAIYVANFDKRGVEG